MAPDQAVLDQSLKKALKSDGCEYVGELVSIGSGIFERVQELVATGLSSCYKVSRITACWNLHKSGCAGQEGNGWIQQEHFALFCWQFQ